MKRYKLLFFIAVIYLTGQCIVDYYDVQTHEEMHKIISVDYGCLDYEMKVTPLSGSFRCTERLSPKSVREDDLHNINEIVNSNITLLRIQMILLFTMSWFILIIKEKK